MNKLIEIKFGSHLYGTNTPTSDLDFKGIYIPEAREIVLGTYKGSVSTSRPKRECERNTKDDVDIEIFSLDRYLGLLIEGQTGALDILFAPKENITYLTRKGDEVMTHIYDNRDRLLTRNVNAFVGYAKQQAAKYGIKGSRLDALKRVMEFLEPFPLHDKLILHEDKIRAFVKECEGILSLEKTPLVEIVMLKSTNKDVLLPHLKINGRACPFHAKVKLAKEIYGKILEEYGARAHKAHLSGGKDWKALSHAVRVNHEALELLTTGKITFPRPERELLVKIKQEQMPYEQVAELIEQGLVTLHDAHLTSTLRDEPDRAWVDDLVYQIYSEVVKGG